MIATELEAQKKALDSEYQTKMDELNKKSRSQAVMKDMGARLAIDRQKK